MVLRTALFAILSALCGLSWALPWHWVGPTLSLFLIPLVLSQSRQAGGSWRSRYGIALAYYLAGSHGIPLASAVFFGPGAGNTIEGIVLWLASSALLAAGWAFADRPWKVALVILLDALVPPLLLFDWMSPLTGAGVLFPGWGLAGLALFLLAIIALRFRSVLVAIVALSLMANLTHAPHPVPAGWVGQDLDLGPSQPDIFAAASRLQQWMKVADQRRAKLLLLPETLLTWWAGSAWTIQRHVPRGATWLVGATVPLSGGYFADGIEAVTDHGAHLLFASALPVPVSMWMPWRTPSPLQATGPKYFLLRVPEGFIAQQYRAFWWTKVQSIEGVRAWANICYDQLLPFVWLEGVLQHPQVILLTNNEWWAKDTGIPQIQAASSWAWARLIDASTIEAENA